MDDVMLLLQSISPENAVVNQMISKAKRAFVEEHHPRQISQLHSKNPYRDGRWKTYVYADGKRMTVECKTEEEVYEALYRFYTNEEYKAKSFEDVFLMLARHKQDELGRSEQTIIEDKRHFRILSEEIRHKPIKAVTEEDIRRWLVKEYLPKKPKKEALKKMIQLVKQVFRYGCRKKLCNSNPVEYLEYSDYANRCDMSTRTNEERSFSEDELERLRQSAIKDGNRPHALMLLVAIETGLRVGELAALKKEDIEGQYLHVHRQQIRSLANGHQSFSDVGYTKNERVRPRGGRYIPISKACAEALRRAEQLPGDSDALFHYPDGRPAQKDSYEQYLRRKCQSLGIDTTNNHAFRVAYNAKLISAHLDDSERALLLGHSVQTNERHYSFSDQRRLDEIKKVLVDG